ncbi:hypothetical protein F511_11491 [Dorcoceras hygrometricum]|uniref:Uncharacterized protein n=1 Tax=Dorcoceras hygrometricum TaxID=472368 RepID=A0A2Z7CYB7_9LAMI|nr:hypothetical protein F511_11491 [Dorcoceras hygrometricum]
MALLLTMNFNNPNSVAKPSQFFGRIQKQHSSFQWKDRRPFEVVLCSGEDSAPAGAQDDEKLTVGVEAALSMLRFYKREFLPNSTSNYLTGVDKIINIQVNFHYLTTMKQEMKYDREWEISPLLPNSCRYVPTCSEYSMIAYKKYGVVKGTVLTAWRLCRCNPLGGSGFDPPRWFDETTPPEE